MGQLKNQSFHWNNHKLAKIDLISFFGTLESNQLPGRCLTKRKENNFSKRTLRHFHPPDPRFSFSSMVAAMGMTACIPGVTCWWKGANTDLVLKNCNCVFWPDWWIPEEWLRSWLFLCAPSSTHTHTHTHLEWLSRQQQHLWKDLKSYTLHDLLGQRMADGTSGWQNPKSPGRRRERRTVIGGIRAQKGHCTYWENRMQCACPGCNEYSEKTWDVLGSTSDDSVGSAPAEGEG